MPKHTLFYKEAIQDLSKIMDKQLEQSKMYSGYPYMPNYPPQLPQGYPGMPPIVSSKPEPPKN